MHVKIHSHWEGKTWEGEIPDPPWTHTLEYVWRFFNVVDDDDRPRLLAIGYDLPSLSVNDVVEVSGTRWRATSIGWEKL